MIPQLAHRDELIRQLFSLSDEEFGATAHPPHIGGAFKLKRLFGGQAVAQAYSVFKRQYPNLDAETMHYKFVGPGDVEVPIDYHLSRIDNLCLAKVFQKHKIIGTGHIRISENEDLYPPEYHPEACDVPSPENSPEMRKAFVDISPSSFDILLKTTIFDMRPINFARIDEEHRIRMWCRIADSDVISHNNGLHVCLALSDFFVVHIVKGHFDRYEIAMPVGASLHHSVRFHMKEEEVDPMAYHLFEVKCDTISMNRGKIHAAVYDTKLRTVLSVVQEAFFQTAPKGSKIKSQL